MFCISLLVNFIYFCLCCQPIAFCRKINGQNTGNTLKLGVFYSTVSTVTQHKKMGMKMCYDKNKTKMFRNKNKIRISFHSPSYKSTKQEIKHSMWHLRTTKRQSLWPLHPPKNKTHNSTYTYCKATSII